MSLLYTIIGMSLLMCDVVIMYDCNVILMYDCVVRMGYNDVCDVLVMMCVMW